MFLRLAILSLLLALTLGGCSSGPRPLTGPNLVVLPLTELPPPTADRSREFHVGAFDTFEIDVFGVEELSKREVRSDAAGTISFPLAGSIDAQGMTMAELARAIEGRLAARYIRDPHVTVNLKDSVSQSVTIDGEVKKPGLYPVAGDMTLMRAIARAEGVSELAKLDEVIIFRTVGTQKMAAVYNLAAIRGGRYADPEIYANDIVVVGNAPGRRAFRDILSIASLAVTPLIILLQQL